ncbi:hypothetical protein NPIL_390011 [Nephila pilipes]|uniref:Uncharacterized protein n=1 Tax=Nephila pilipes TaxID=299642 RepID=A0A8X6UL29_NEPPI|nr:hypothetical protein NPIL_390011 [Nephila pilipes]
MRELKHRIDKKPNHCGRLISENDCFRCLKKQDVCAKGKVAEVHVFQRIALKEFAADMNQANGNRTVMTAGRYKCHNNGMACSQKLSTIVNCTRT